MSKKSCRLHAVRFIATALVASLAGCVSASRAQTTGPAISIDIAAGQHPISPYIYGMSQYGGIDPTFQAQTQLPVVRWGGDLTSRYNWTVDSSNAGKDWYYQGGSGVASPTPSAGPDALVAADRAASGQTLITVPMIPYVNTSSAYNCSYPLNLYGPQQQVDPYPDVPGNCGNGVSTAGVNLADSNIPANNTPNTTQLQSQWVQHLVSTFGPRGAGGVMAYELDNEPYIWNVTHRDIVPAQMTYDSLVALTEQYAPAIKAIDPSALVIGPSDFGWTAYVGSTAENTEHGGLWDAPWYLQQMAAYQEANNIRLIDDFDEHYYPTGPGDDAWVLRSTRSLWDPTYVDESWIGQWYGAIYLIPRMQGWVQQYYPGTKVSIGEYAWPDHGTIVGALAEADVLGIFGRQALDMATMWGPPNPANQPVAFSFRLYRNYDGAGHQFGRMSVQTASADQSTVSAYGAISAGNVLTLVLINKTASTVICPISVADPAPSGSASMFSYSSADLSAIHQLSDVAFSAGTANVAVAGMSMNILALKLP